MAYTLLLIPPLLWSTMMVVGQYVLGQVPPATLTFWTWLVAVLSLLPFAFRYAGENLAIIRREFTALFFFALLGVAGFQYLLFSGLAQASAISASVLSPMIPIIVACLGCFLLKEKLSIGQTFGVILSFLGACWVATLGEWGNLLNLNFGKGEWLILAANLSMAGYTIMLRLFPTRLPPLVFMFAIALIGTVQIFPVSLMETDFAAGMAQIMSVPWSILYIGVVNYSLAYVFWNIAVEKHGATMTAIFLYLIPIFGTLLSMIFLQEQLFVYHIVGVVLICFGIYFALHRKPNEGLAKETSG